MLNSKPAKPLGEAKNPEWENARTSMRLLGKIAADFDIKLCIEVVNRFEGHIFNTACQGNKFVKEVGLDNVKLLLDGFHVNIEENSIKQAVLDAGDNLGHFHFVENHRGLPGTGHIPWHEVNEAMKEIQYNGVMVMESFVLSGGSLGDCVHVWRDMVEETNEEYLNMSAKQALDYAKKIFE